MKVNEMNEDNTVGTVSNEEINTIEEEIKKKEAQKATDDKSKAEKEIREQIAKEQELLDMKKKLAEVEAEKAKMEALVIEQKKQYETETTELKSQIGSTKAIHTQSQEETKPKLPVMDEAAKTDINKESQRAWEEFLDKNKNKFRG